MSKTELGCQVLQEKGHFSDFSQFIQQHGHEDLDTEIIMKLKSILWAVVSWACVHIHACNAHSSIGQCRCHGRGPSISWGGGYDSSCPWHCREFFYSIPQRVSVTPNLVVVVWHSHQNVFFCVGLDIVDSPGRGYTSRVWLGSCTLSTRDAYGHLHTCKSGKIHQCMFSCFSYEAFSSHVSRYPHGLNAIQRSIGLGSNQ